ncbi:DUF4142 domain-containing protein [Novosphingobium sp. P6W]|uniref:DUF4142 domain-containing protein n=1 Tax=Novosphingobium sp. P6W TaxID=1609758 RepID=UPI0005C2F442|nr:DUF4142 domain-containing protein [Novosphingobium sp. P6W]AXB78359.1 DUF4142 domain-containing protein [Novosphingobium sp. P6W]KIS32310.1 membrane protein [Novosphingobium sp. P6W]
MKQSLLLAVSLAALGLAGCNKQSDSPGEPAASVAPASTSATDSAVKDVDKGQAFANIAAASDAFEIESSKLAITKATTAKIKSFANDMIEAHTKSTVELKAAAGAASPAITPNAALTAAQKATLDQLAAKSGADFDRAYAAAQASAHAEALDALKGYSVGGEVASLKAFATKLIPIVTAHLNMAKSI